MYKNKKQEGCKMQKSVLINKITICELQEIVTANTDFSSENRRI